MVDLIYCELLKLKRSKMLLLSIIGAMATPILMTIEALQTHFKYPERIFTLNDIYDYSLLYAMLLMNIMVYVAITAYLFSREYTENTLKTILPVPISRTKLVIGKFLTLFFWSIMLMIVTWAGPYVIWNLSPYIWIEWFLPYHCITMAFKIAFGRSIDVSNDFPLCIFG